MSKPAGSKYKALGDMLLGALPASVPQKWLADKTFVSQEAVHYWLKGQTRPAPDRLGHIAALFHLQPEQLAALAGYDRDPNALSKLLAAYEIWQGQSSPTAGDSLALSESRDTHPDNDTSNRYEDRR
jgi:transcriptional regulator with XRE-family HTH domain